MKTCPLNDSEDDEDEREKGESGKAQAEQVEGWLNVFVEGVGDFVDRMDDFVEGLPEFDKGLDEFVFVGGLDEFLIGRGLVLVWGIDLLGCCREWALGFLQRFFLPGLLH